MFDHSPVKHARRHMPPTAFLLQVVETCGSPANPIERVFGDVHDKCTRNHQRKRLRDVVGDVERHLHVNGPWRSKLSRSYEEPEVTAAVERMTATLQDQLAA